MDRVYPDQEEAAMAEPALALQEPAPAAETAPARTLRRVWFRFAFVWLALYLFPFPLGSTLFTYPITVWYRDVWIRIVLWVGAALLHLKEPIAVATTGSGDRTFDYV